MFSYNCAICKAGCSRTKTDSFEEKSLESALEKIVFLSLDGVSVSCGKNSGVIKLLEEEYPWISFTWCFGHRLELALKDALKTYMETVNKTLIHLCYLYTKSSQKHLELKNLYMLKDEFQMYHYGVRPMNAIGRGWIDHKLQAIDRLIEKYGLYCVNIRELILTTTNSKEKATLEGNLNRLVDAKSLLRYIKYKARFSLSMQLNKMAKIDMSYIKMKKLIICVKKIHTESRPGDVTCYYLLL